MDFKELETFFPEDDDNLEDLLPKIFWIYIKNIQYSTMFYLFVLIYEVRDCFFLFATFHHHSTLFIHPTILIHC